MSKKKSENMNDINSIIIDEAVKQFKKGKD